MEPLAVRLMLFGERLGPIKDAQFLLFATTLFDLFTKKLLFICSGKGDVNRQQL